MSKRLTDVASRLAAKPAPLRQIIYIVDFENIPKTDVAGLLRKKHVAMVVLAANRTNTVTPETLKTIEANPDRVDVIIGRITRKEFVDKLVTAKIGEYAFRYPEAEIIVLANDKDYADLARHLNDHWERPVPIVHVAPGKTTGRAASSGRTGSGRGSRSRGGPKAAPAPAAKAAPAAKTASVPKPAAKEEASPSPSPKPSRSKRASGRSEKSSRRQAQPTPTPKAAAKPTPKNESPSKATSTAKSPAATKRSGKDLTNPDAEAVRALLANLPKRRLPKSESALLNAIRNYRESVGLRSRPSTILKNLEDGGILARDGGKVSYTL